MNKLIAAYEAMNTDGVVVHVTTTSSELAEFGRFLIDSVVKETKERIKQGEDDVLLTTNEAMNILKVNSQATIWRWGKKGYLTPIRSGGKCFYRKSDIDKILTSKTHQI